MKSLHRHTDRRLPGSKARPFHPLTRTGQRRTGRGPHSQSTAPITTERGYNIWQTKTEAFFPHGALLLVLFSSDFCHCGNRQILCNLYAQKAAAITQPLLMRMSPSPPPAAVQIHRRGAEAIQRIPKHLPSTRGIFPRPWTTITYLPTCTSSDPPFNPAYVGIFRTEVP